MHEIHKLMDEVVESSFDERGMKVDFSKLSELLSSSQDNEQVSWEKVFQDRKMYYSPLLTVDYLDRLNTILGRFINQSQLLKEEPSAAILLSDYINTNGVKISDSPFDSLPTELLYCIFERVNPQDEEHNVDEENAMLACKRFCSVIGKTRGIRQLRKGIEKALGNLLENIQPDTRILKHIGNNIFSIAEADIKTAIKELGPVLARASRKPYSMQNQIIATLIEAWKEQGEAVLEDRNGDNKTFIDLLKALYQHHLCNPANKIHIASLANKGGIIAGYENEIASWNPPLKGESQDGIILALESSFKREPVDNHIIPKLIISGDNTFKIGEIVAVGHKGSLIGKRKKLWYGVVREITEIPEGRNLYRVYTQLHQREGKKCWIYDDLATPGELGKIASIPSNINILGKTYSIENKHAE